MGRVCLLLKTLVFFLCTDASRLEMWLGFFGGKSVGGYVFILLCFDLVALLVSVLGWFFFPKEEKKQE